MDRLGLIVQQHVDVLEQCIVLGLARWVPDALRPIRSPYCCAKIVFRGAHPNQWYQL